LAQGETAAVMLRRRLLVVRAITEAEFAPAIATLVQAGARGLVVAGAESARKPQSRAVFTQPGPIPNLQGPTTNRSSRWFLPVRFRRAREVRHSLYGRWGRARRSGGLDEISKSERIGRLAA
jgi:hypothetical protein